jgi:hypothetical protein
VSPMRRVFPCRGVPLSFTIGSKKGLSTQTVMGDDAGIEARSSKNEARVSSFHIRASIRVSTTPNVNFN